ncbi:MAG: alpha/beta hydrolase [Mycobacterium sp.]|uniref:alpha/beta fold hydrolase n=1 Tax=Mycobacterium sp. TaxID=1785 RepID=UPI001ECCA32F|nr:alpha/beta hydrolase [Mycobacterium sp.]MBV8785825.1 alpha/beta hydrolase [Mycobacterium sp.]
MGLPSLVLVHGGQHAGDCWEPTIERLGCLDPDLKVLAVDLPGRRGKSGDLITACLHGWVDSVVSDIDAAGLDDLVIVAHSMAGLIVPGVVAKLGSARVREMILAAAYVPPDGSALVDTMPGPLGWYARHVSLRKAQKGEPSGSRFYPESPSIVLESVDRSAMPHEVPRTWILTTRDRALSVKLQRASIQAIGGVQQVISVETCHNLMISEPEKMAQILVERCRLYG